MIDIEKQRIAKVITNALPSAIPYEFARKRSMYNPTPTDVLDAFARQIISGSGDEWWAIINWVKADKDCWWEWIAAEHTFFVPDVVEAAYTFTHSNNEGGEYWARLSCIAQALEAGILQ